MPRQPASTGLFGQTPDAIRRAMMAEQLQEAQLIGNLGPGGHGAMIGGHLGQAFQGLMGQDTTDPRLRQAQQMQRIQAQLRKMGLQPGTPEFTKAVGKLVTAQMGVAEGTKAWQAAAQLEKQRAEVEALRGGPAKEAREREGLYRILKRMKHSEEDATEISQYPDIAKVLIKDGLTPEKLTAAQKEYAQAQQEGFQGSFMDYRQAIKPSTSVRVDVGGGQAFQTDVGKIANDILRAQQMPDGPLREATLDALHKKQATTGTSMEVQRANERMAATENLIDWFQDIAQTNPDIVGTSGVITKLKTADNLLGVALRHFNPTTIPEGQLAAVTAQMRALLGTAFSGAAIPEREWGTYQAQVPAITDDPNLMQGKMLAYRRMMKYLVNRAKAKARQEDLSETTLVDGELPFPAVKLDRKGGVPEGVDPAVWAIMTDKEKANF